MTEIFQIQVIILHTITISITHTIIILKICVLVTILESFTNILWLLV